MSEMHLPIYIYIIPSSFQFGMPQTLNLQFGELGAPDAPAPISSVHADDAYMLCAFVPYAKFCCNFFSILFAGCHRTQNRFENAARQFSLHLSIAVKRQIGENVLALRLTCARARSRSQANRK